MFALPAEGRSVRAAQSVKDSSTERDGRLAAAA